MVDGLVVLLGVRLVELWAYKLVDSWAILKVVDSAVRMVYYEVEEKVND